MLTCFVAGMLTMYHVSGTNVAWNGLDSFRQPSCVALTVKLLFFLFLFTLQIEVSLGR